MANEEVTDVETVVAMWNELLREFGNMRFAPTAEGQPTPYDIVTPSILRMWLHERGVRGWDVCWDSDNHELSIEPTGAPTRVDVRLTFGQLTEEQIDEWRRDETRKEQAK